jgi:anaerobic magnesium-protoporphyrin IX monomethyl ester cyclase
MIKRISPKTVIFCGGAHPTVDPKSILECQAIDAFFIGESDYSFVEVLNKINNNQPYKDTENLCYIENGTVKINPLKPLIQNLDDLPYVDKTTYPYIDSISPLGGAAQFMFSRGCPYLCSYCCNHAIAKLYGMRTNKSRARSPESCIREIEDTLKQFPQVKTIWIFDDTFGLDKTWRKEFLQKYKERIPIKFACMGRANHIDEEFAKMLADSGCYRVSIGIESGNDYVRNMIMNRHMTNEQIVNAFAVCKKYRLETNAINIIGVPGETEEMIWNTINLNRKINPTSSGVNIFYPYKSTVLGDQCFEKGLVDEELYKKFSSERRETVLKYPENYKKKLTKFHQDWTCLIYPWNVTYRAKWLLMKSPFLWNSLRKTKRTVYNFLKIEG